LPAPFVITAPENSSKNEFFRVPPPFSAICFSLHRADTGAKSGDVKERRREKILSIYSLAPTGYLTIEAGTRNPEHYEKAEECEKSE